MPRGVKRPVDIVISSDDEDYIQPTQPPPTSKATRTSYAGPSAGASTSYGGSYRDVIVIPDSPPPVRATPRPPVAPPSLYRPPRAPSPRVLSPIKPPPAKRQRKQKDPDSEPAQTPEKRLAIFKKKCPQAIRERAERVATQRYSHKLIAFSPSLIENPPGCI